MHVYDILILVLLVGSTIWGARRGLAKQVAAICSLVLSYTVAVSLRQQLAEVIDVPEPWNLFAAMIGLFVATSLGVWIGFRFVHGSIEKAGLKTFDTQMGGLFGLAKGVIVAMLLTMLTVATIGENQRHAVLHSFSGYHICRLLARTESLVPSEWQRLMGPYLEIVEEHHHGNDPADDEAHPDPFELASPSDVRPGLYDDQDFGKLPDAEQDLFAPVPERPRTADASREPKPRVSLQSPVFDSRR